MELLKLVTKNEVTAIGLTQFKDRDMKYAFQKATNYKRIFYKPNYDNNFLSLMYK